MPAPLITRRDIANGAVSSQPRTFDRFGGKARAARVPFKFPSANVAVGMPHPLGRTPTSWRVVHVDRACNIFSPMQGTTGGGSVQTSTQYTMSRNYIVLACDTANVYAEIEIT